MSEKEEEGKKVFGGTDHQSANDNSSDEKAEKCSIFDDIDTTINEMKKSSAIINDYLMKESKIERIISNKMEKYTKPIKAATHKPCDCNNEYFDLSGNSKNNTSDSIESPIKNGDVEKSNNKRKYVKATFVTLSPKHKKK